MPMTEQEMDDALEHARLDEKLSVARQSDEAPQQTSSLGAAMRGGAKGATFGLADEAYGVVGALFDPANMQAQHPEQGYWGGILDRYKASRDYARERDQQSEEGHPIAFHGAELAGTVASPVNKLFAPSGAAKGFQAFKPMSETAKVLETVGKGAASGALSGVGNSNADTKEGLAMAAAGGAGLGGALSGAGRLASNFLGKLTPDNLKRSGTRLLAKAAGAEGSELESAAPLLSAADEAGAPVIGYGSRASDISEAAAAKARYYGGLPPAPEAGPTWRPFGGRETRLVGGGMVDAEEAAAARAAAAANTSKAEGYQKIAAAAGRKAEDQGAKGSDYGLPTAGIMASVMSGHFRPGHIAAMTALGVGKQAVRERGASFAGRAALGAGEALGALPEEVGTVAGAIDQYAVQSGTGAQTVTQQAMGLSPESAADLREKRLREMMVKRLRDLSNQGYPSPQPIVRPQSP